MENNSNNKGSLLGIFIVIWFLGSVFLLIFFANRGEEQYLQITFGQVFVIMGLMFLSSQLKDLKKKRQKEKNYIYRTTTLSAVGFPALFILVGLFAIAAGFIALNPEKFPSINIGIIGFVGLLFLFFISGISVVSLYFSANKKFKDKRLIPIQTVVSGLNFTHSDGKKVYAAILKYTFNGKEYVHASNMYTNINVPNVGDMIDARINGLAPEEIYFKSSGNILILIIGLPFIIIPVVILFGYLKSLM